MEFTFAEEITKENTECVRWGIVPRTRVGTSLVCDPMGWGPPGSSVNGILQARILEWVAIPFSRRSSPPGD